MRQSRPCTTRGSSGRLEAADGSVTAFRPTAPAPAMPAARPALASSARLLVDAFISLLPCVSPRTDGGGIGMRRSDLKGHVHHDRLPCGAVDPRRRTIALLALTLGVFLVTLNVTVVVVALPDIANDLQAAPDATAWIIDAYNLVGASLLLTAGFLADRFGRRRMLLTGYALFSGGALLCALAPTISWLLAFRVVQAVGGTALTPTSLAIVANIYPDPRERAKAIGIWGVSSGLGLGLGPIIGGAAVDALGWRAVFAVNAVIGLAALIAVL